MRETGRGDVGELVPRNALYLLNESRWKKALLCGTDLPLV
jgi:hypothetical protein